MDPNATDSADLGDWSGYDWGDYYARRTDRPPRELLLRAHTTYTKGGRGPGEAVDLGCGDGADTAWLLRHGWSVTAVDASAASERHVRANAEGYLDRLDLIIGDLATTELPEADLVVACFSLPYVPPARFGAMWDGVRAALQPGAVLAVTLFGERDSWAGRFADMTFHSRAQVDARFAGLDVLELTEDEQDGTSDIGPKHWHTFDVIARRPW
ncbi:class I SAM-dependent methyltransferase [Angustibacter sp. McL0619]|uniref:class I SAM-dependent methyltransferase n=1 Tax=Angustibacter sp. McL0619 TaxID=3415676 RepID=UPI003CF5ACA1